MDKGAKLAPTCKSRHPLTSYRTDTRRRLMPFLWAPAQKGGKRTRTRRRTTSADRRDDHTSYDESAADSDTDFRGLSTDADDRHQREAQADDEDPKRERAGRRCNISLKAAAGWAMARRLRRRDLAAFDHLHPLPMPHLQLLRPLPQSEVDNQHPGKHPNHKNRREKLLSLYLPAPMLPTGES